MFNSMMPVYAAIVAAALAIASAAYTLNRQQSAATLKDRQQTYAAIMGRKHLRSQILVSRFEALVFSDFHERRWRLAGTPADSFDFQEAQRWMHRSEDLVLEFARTNQALFESLAAARTAFPPSPELTQLTEALYHFGTPVIAPAPPDADNQALEQWKTQAVKQLQALVDKSYSAPTDALLKHLEANMQSKL